MSDDLYPVAEMEARGWSKVPASEGCSGFAWQHAEFGRQHLNTVTRIMLSQDEHQARGRELEREASVAWHRKEARDASGGSGHFFTQSMADGFRREGRQSAHIHAAEMLMAGKHLRSDAQQPPGEEATHAQS